LAITVSRTKGPTLLEVWDERPEGYVEVASRAFENSIATTGRVLDSGSQCNEENDTNDTMPTVNVFNTVVEDKGFKSVIGAELSPATRHRVTPLFLSAANKFDLIPAFLPA
jgi:hypothetical protein